MRIAVFGGTGRVGSRLIALARAAGYSVSALARDPARLPAGLVETVVAGDVTDPAAVLATLSGTDAVLSALGGGPPAQPGTTLSSGCRHIVQAMQRAGVRRILAVAGSGVLDHPDGGLRGDAPDFPSIYRAINAEHLGTYRGLQESPLEWTLLCCPDLVDAEPRGRYRVTADRLPDGAGSIATGDVAHCLLRELPRTTFVRRRIGIATDSRPGASATPAADVADVAPFQR